MNSLNDDRRKISEMLKMAMKSDGYSYEQRQFVALAVKIAAKPPESDRLRGPFMRGLAQKVCGHVAAQEAKLAMCLTTGGNGDGGEPPQRLPHISEVSHRSDRDGPDR